VKRAYQIPVLHSIVSGLEDPNLVKDEDATTDLGL
jgi:hypothetical protein